MDSVKQRIITIGRAMLALGLQNTHSGNISVRAGDEMYITKTGSMKGHLEERDICKPGLSEPEYGLFQASSETGQHRRVLQYAGGMIHAHSYPVVLMSYLTEAIVPLDAYGRAFLGRVPVVAFEYPVGSPEMEEQIPEVLQKAPAMVVKTHGPFVRGADLEEAFFNLCLLDHSAAVLYNLLRMGERGDAIPLPRVPELERPITPGGRMETADPTLAEQFQRTGRDLFYLKLSPFQTGSLSVADGNDMLYAPGLSLPEGLQPDIRRLPIGGGADSFFADLHRAVYRSTNAKAALFTLSPEATTLSLPHLAAGSDRIVPADAEGGYLYPAVPVLPPDAATEKIVAAAERYKMVVLAGLGALAIGHTPGHVIHHNSSLKNLCHFLIELSVLRRLGDIPGLEPFLCEKGKTW